MSKFKVGEIAIIQCKIDTRLNGTECEITEPALDNWCDVGEVTYGFKSPHTNKWRIREASLRKKHPPNELGTWDNETFKTLGFDPRKQKVMG